MIGAAEVVFGKVAGIGLNDPGVAQQHLLVHWQGGLLTFRTFAGCQLLVGNAPVSEGRLSMGQQFRLGASTWQVGDTPVSVVSLLDSVGGRLNKLAGTDKLEGFSLKEMFSEVFKKRKPEDLEDYFIVGTSRTTPRIEDVQTGWPKPWFFFRVLMFVGIVYLGFLISMEEFNNPNLVPGLIMMGAFAMPLATVFLLFELNTPRNVAFYQVLMLVCLGGVVSLFVSLIGFSVSALGWLGASQAGIIEEIGKLLAVIIVARRRSDKYILNGLLFGAAVGAGFAAFESAGYAFRALLGNGGVSAMTQSILLRGMLAPFGHVAWTAIAAGALWRVKGDKTISPGMLVNGRFLSAFIIPVVIHMLWNSPLPSTFFLKHLFLGVISWFVVFGFVQQGLRQVRNEQLAQVKAEFGRTQQMAAASGIHKTFQELQQQRG